MTVDINCIIEDLASFESFKQYIEKYLNNGYIVKSYKLEKYDKGFGHVKIILNLTNKFTIIRCSKGKLYKKLEKILKELI